MAKTKLHVDKDPLLTDNVSEHYKKFFNKFEEINSLPITEWKVVHLLGYLCAKYEAYYNLKYSFKFNNPAPSKSYEVYQIKKLSNMLSSDPTILKQYLDWVFDKKIIEKNKRITSLGYFTHLDIINEFKFKFLFNKKTIIRTDNLPDSIINICSKYGVSISNYAELAFVKKMPDKSDLINEIKDTGFDLNILDKIA